jgi:hypothetical protein
MKRKRIIWIFPMIVAIALLTASCASCGRGSPVIINRAFPSVIESLEALSKAGPEAPGTVEVDQKRQTAVVSFWGQAIFWKGTRYNIAVRSITADQTELRGWACEDSSMVPGYNAFKKRPLGEKSYEDLLARGDRQLEGKKTQPSAATLPSAPQAGPSEGAR